jgi:hypothetical protein
MIATARNNGKHNPSGAGYGLKITPADRDAYFDKRWKSIILELPYRDRWVEIEIKLAKKSFWGSQCRAIVNKEIGRWLLAHQLAPWPKRRPPLIEIEPLGGKRFGVLGFVTR